ncbi:tyrosine-type recombinase/integrase [Terasakiella pusilla]|uniref:tyrosine-type recombinase/integrase n=1 Tax=Terasakiella pusilla TaxID=64973 RepID=UPI003AA93FE4
MTIQNVVVQDYRGKGVIRLFSKSKNYFMRFKINEQKGWTAWRTTKSSIFAEAAKAASEEYARILDQTKDATKGSIDLARVYDDLTFEGVARQWFEEYKQCAANGTKPSGSTKKASIKQVPEYEKHIDRYIHEFFSIEKKKLKISRITKKVLEEYIAWRRTYYTEGPGKNIDTVKVMRNGKSYEHKLKHKVMELPSGAMGMINSVLQYALRHGLISASQCPEVPKPVKDFRDIKQSRRPAFSKAHWEALEKAIPNYIKNAPRDKERRARENLAFYIRIMAEMGIRPGKEHNQIQWKHVAFNEDERTQAVTALVTISENTKSGTRQVVVAPYGAALLKELKEWSEYTSDEDYVFANPVNGKPVIRFDASFNKLMEFAQITHSVDGRKYAPYSLRHTYATRSREAGLPDHIIAMNMGHENETMVQRIYGQDEITSHTETIIAKDKKRNPEHHKSLATDLLIQTVIGVAQNNGLVLEKDNNKALEIIDGEIKVIKSDT